MIKFAASQILRRSAIRAFAIVLSVVVLLILIFFVALNGSQSHRTESYKDASGAAGLDATIEYDCKHSCEQKFSFNVYILNEDGQQFGVLRPDTNGRVRLAAPEGNYVMLVGKLFGNDKIFPQEPLTLKNGTMLELKLRY